MGLLSSKITTIQQMSKQFYDLRIKLNYSLSKLYNELAYAGVCINSENCTPDEKLIAVERSSLLTGFNKQILGKQSKEKTYIPYKIEPLYINENIEQNINKDIDEAKEYINYKLKLYNLFNKITSEKYYCISYSEDIIKISSILYKNVEKMIKQKKEVLNQNVLKNLKDVADKIISLLKINIDYIKSIIKIIDQLNDSVDLNQLSDIENNIYDILKKQEIKCCKIADLLEDLALIEQNENYINVFTGNEQSFPNVENLHLKKASSFNCNDYIKHFNQLSKY